MTAMPEQGPERRCGATTNTGEPCGVDPGLLIEDDQTPGVYWCFNHHPDYEDARAAARSKGGLRTAAKVQRFRFLDKDELGRLDSPEDARRIAALVAMAVATGRLSSAAGGTVLKSLDTWLHSNEQTELAVRLDAMEKQLQRGRTP